MWDGSAVPLEENLSIAAELLELTSAANVILEIEVGVVGGEEDGVAAEINEKLYTTPEDGLRTVEVLGTGEKGRYITALTFGNVHGVYKPGAVKLRPEVLKDIQEEVGNKIGKERPFDLVFHGGSILSRKSLWSPLVSRPRQFWASAVTIYLPRRWKSSPQHIRDI